MRMYIRLFIIMVMAFFRRKNDGKPDRSVLAFRVMPWDCVLRYMGNDRYHSFMDLGRVDLALRLGWVKALFKRRWSPQVVGCYIRYQFPLGLFDQFFLKTYIIYSDEISVWMAHQFEKDGIIYSSAISKMVAVSKFRIVRLRQMSCYQQGIRKWPFDKETVKKFYDVLTVLEDLDDCAF